VQKLVNETNLWSVGSVRFSSPPSSVMMSTLADAEPMTDRGCELGIRWRIPVGILQLAPRASDDRATDMSFPQPEAPCVE
jgi:hypothetical protein